MSNLIKRPGELAPKKTISMLIYGVPGIGKAQPVDSLVLTPSGFKAIGSLSIGDEVIGQNGKTQKVLGVFPQGVRPTYKVSFNDGATVLCDEEHIWTVRKRNGSKEFYDLTLREMLRRGLSLHLSKSREDSGRGEAYKFAVPLVEPVEFEHKSFDVDPYILGVLIGDGSLVGNTAIFSNTENDAFIREKVAHLLPDGYELHCCNASATCPQYSIVLTNQTEGTSYLRRIVKLGLNVHSGDKFIPEQYFLGDKEQRLELLRGLMDTDGCSHEGNKICFSSSSERLANDVITLVRSLGGLAKLATYERENKSTEFRVNIRLNVCPFSLPRKASNWRPSKFSRIITGAERIADTECVCIYVSNEDHLYVTDDYVVTHNTTIACSAPNPVLFDTDGGVQRINGAHQVPTVQVSSWEDVQDAINEIGVLEKKGELVCDTIIIDTVGKALDYMSEYIIRHEPKMGQRDGSLSLKGYGVRKTMFINLIKQLSVMGKNVVFVAHNKEDKQNDYIYNRPDIGGSSASDLIKELDLVGFMTAYGNERVISFDPNEYYIAKNACNLAPNMNIPVVVDRATGEATGKNDFLTGVIASYEEWQVKTRERTAAYNVLLSSIKDAVGDAKNADDLNNLIKAIAKKETIYDSKLKAGQMLNAKAVSLGCKYDKLTKAYVAA